MKADYKNWVPNGMIFGFGAAAAGLAAVAGETYFRTLGGRSVGLRCVDGMVHLCQRSVFL